MRRGCLTRFRIIQCRGCRCGTARRLVRSLAGGDARRFISLTASADVKARGPLAPLAHVN